MSEKTAPQPEKDSGPIGEISQDPSAFEAFLDANQKKLIIVGILAILCLVGYVIYDGLRKMANRNAAGDVAAARTVPDYDAVSKNHEGQNAGGSALIYKSQLLWRDQQQQEAITAVESFITGYPDHPALGNAYASLGSYQQQLGNLDAATTAFEKSAETKSSASSLALLSLGDLALNRGKGEEARAFYDRIITEYETSHFQVKQMARDRIKLIGVKAPTDKVAESIKPTIIPSVTSQPVAIPGLPGALKPKPSLT
ncbi:MAG: TolA-binding protein, partial [Akkermansiaceae bacterium]